MTGLDLLVQQAKDAVRSGSVPKVLIYGDTQKVVISRNKKSGNVTITYKVQKQF
jgi:hypothetical protein